MNAVLTVFSQILAFFSDKRMLLRLLDREKTIRKRIIKAYENNDSGRVAYWLDELARVRKKINILK